MVLPNHILMGVKSNSSRQSIRLRMASQRCFILDFISRICALYFIFLKTPLHYTSEDTVRKLHKSPAFSARLCFGEPSVSSCQATMIRNCSHDN